MSSLMEVFSPVPFTASDNARELWLQRMTEALIPHFEAVGYRIPANIRVSCGWPKGSRGGNKAIGQCWNKGCSADGTFEIFITPEIADPIRAADILVHEIVHTVVGLEAKHGKHFKKCAQAVGLTGKMTATVADASLVRHLETLTAQIGPYPHARLSSNEGLPKPGSRLVKMVCPDCEYTIRTTEKWLAEGFPLCHCGATFQRG